MTPWKIPAKVKIYEAFSALADERVSRIAEFEAKVTSSMGDRTYTIKWDESLRQYASDDNASRWQGTLGYPVIAVLIHLGVLSMDPKLLIPFAGIPWRKLNDQAKRNYDQVVEKILSELEAKGLDRRSVEQEVDRIHSRLSTLQLQRFG